jgi:hypothetical protein
LVRGTGEGRFVIGKAELASFAARRSRSALIDEDREEPHTELASFLEAADRAEGAEKRLLNDILGVGVVAQHATRHAGARAVVPLRERRIRVDVSLHGARNESLVRH